MKTADLMSHLTTRLKSANSILIRNVLSHYTTQDMIQMDRFEVFTLINPEKVKRCIDQLIVKAAWSEGIVNKKDIRDITKQRDLNPDLLLHYLENENACYTLGPGKWVFPNVRKKKRIEQDDRTLTVLNSESQVTAYRIVGPSDLVFSRLSVSIAREYGAPENNNGYLTSSSGLWIMGNGKEKTALLIQLNPSKGKSVIRIKAGGGRGKEIFSQIDELMTHILEAYASEYSRLS